MDILNEIYVFAKEHDVVIDITFNRTDGIRIDMDYCPLRRSIYLSESELRYNKVNVEFILEEMFDEIEERRKNYEL